MRPKRSKTWLPWGLRGDEGRRQDEQARTRAEANASPQPEQPQSVEDHQNSPRQAGFEQLISSSPLVRPTESATTPSGLSPQTEVALLDAIAAAWEELRDRANTANFEQLLQDVFGSTTNQATTFTEAARQLAQQIGAGDQLDLRFTLLSGTIMGAAAGAYAAAGTDGHPTVFINGDWLEVASANQLRLVLLEEIGHHLDQRLNGSFDTAGDEGQLFANLLSGNPLDSADLNALRNDDDHGILLINGQRIAAEFAIISAGISSSTLGATSSAQTLNRTTAEAISVTVTYDDQKNDGGDILIAAYNGTSLIGWSIYNRASNLEAAGGRNATATLSLTFNLAQFNPSIQSGGLTLRAWQGTAGGATPVGTGNNANPFITSGTSSTVPFRANNANPNSSDTAIPANNTGGFATWANIRVDTAAPEAPILSLGAGVSGGATAAEATAATGVISLTAESGSSVSVTFSRAGGGSFTKSVTGNGSNPVPVVLTSADLSTLGNGSINVSATATDAAGNSSAAANTSFSLDTTAPATPSLTLRSDTGPRRRDGITSDSAVVVSGLEAGTSSMLSINGGDTWLNLTGGSIQLGEGLYDTGRIQIRQTDAAGNTSIGSNASAWIIDQTAPGFSSGTTCSLAENSGSNQAIYTPSLNGSEALTGNIVFYSLAPNADSSLFSVDTFSGSIRLTINPDYETRRSYSFILRATDLAGLSSDHTVTLNILDLDEQAPNAPVINTIETDDIINAAEAADGVVISGSAEGGSSVAITWGGVTKTVTASGSSSGTGIWSTTFSNLELPADGTSTITATATDTAGNLSVAGHRNVLMDRATPGRPTLAAVDGDHVINAAEKAAGITLSGSAEAGSSIAISWNGSTRTTTADASTGAWSLTYDSNQIPADSASSSISLTATDRAGNVSTPITRSVRIDTAAPNAPVINAIATNDIINTAEKTAGITLSGSGEIGSTVALSWGTFSATTTVNSSGLWSVSVPTASVPPDAASSTVSVTLTDSAGNTSTAATRSVRIDTAAPSAPVINAVATDNIINAAEKTAGISISGTTDAEDGSTVSITWGNLSRTTTVTGGVWSLNYTSAQIPADTASSTITASVTDTAGNVSTAGTRSVVIDTAAPTITVSSLSLSSDTGTRTTDFITNTASQTLSGTLSANLAATDTVWVRLNSGAWTQANTPTANSFSASLNLGASDNAGTLSVQVRDAAGNPAATRTQAYTLDTRAAGVSIASFRLSADTGISTTDLITSTATQTFSGTLSANLVAGESVWYRLNSGSWTLASATAGRNTYSFSGTLTSGTNTVEVQHRDIAGNASDTSSYSVTRDASAPTLSSLVLNSGGADNLYGLGDVITVTASFSENVLVTGTPRVALNIGGIARYATYTAGSGTNTLSFSYTAAAGDTDANGISLPANALQLNQGTIRDNAGNNALISSSAIADLAAAAVDTGLPTLSAVGIADSGNQIVLTMSEALQAGAVDASRFALTNAPAGVSITGASANGNQVTLTLSSAVTPANAANLAVAYTDTTGNQASGVIQDLAGNDAATSTARAATSFTGSGSLTLAASTTITTASLTGSAADSLTGNAAANTLIGNSGANVITGGGGKDTLTGGASADTFRYTANNESLLAGFDVITDFNTLEDRIDASRVTTATLAANRTTTAVTALTQTGISAVLTNATFGAAVNAAVFRFGSNYYLALNDGNQGFQSASDAIIQLGGVTDNTMAGQVQII